LKILITWISMEIIPFNFETNNIRTFTDEFGNIWFVAKDVALLLDYKDTDKAVRQHCKKSQPISAIFNPAILEGLNLHLIFGNNYKSTKLIPEGDLWRLIIKSEMPEAEKVEKWIMEEVLPTLRKTGTYSIRTPETPHQTFDIKFYTQQSREIFELVEFINSKSIKNLYFADKLYKTLNLQLAY